MKVGSEPKVQAQATAVNPDNDVQPEAPKDKGGPTPETRSKDEFQDAPAASGPDLQGGVQGGKPSAALEAPAAQGTTDPEPAVSMEDARRELDQTQAGKDVLEDWKKLQANGGLTIDLKPQAGRAAGGWYEGARRIELDPSYTKTTAEAVELLSHETTHASQSDGLHPERDGVDKPGESFETAGAYADHRVEMEVRAQARAFDVLHESKLTTTFYPAIQKGYDEAVAQGGRDPGIKYLTEQVNADQLFPGTRASAVEWWDKNVGPTKTQRAAG